MQVNCDGFLQYNNVLVPILLMDPWQITAP
jgi:hypothetical protein